MNSPDLLAVGARAQACEVLSIALAKSLRS